MGVQRTTFEKLQRERNKKAKAAAKRARREEKGSEEEGVDGIELPEMADDDGLGELSAAELLQRVELIHQRFEAKLISFEEFEEAKSELFARITVD
jgi:hypothetical protein